MSIPTPRTYHLAASTETGWELLEEFQELNAESAIEHVETVLCAPGREYADLDWYILNDSLENIFG